MKKQVTKKTKRPATTKTNRAHMLFVLQLAGGLIGVMVYSGYVGL